MNKTAIKNVATFARKELINQVSLRAQSFGFTPNSAGEMEFGSDYVIINGLRYPKSFQEPFKALQKEIEKKDFQQVVEEVAYTWFNRFVALRFMEVNEYLPSKIRVLSSQTPGKVDPDILTMYREVDFIFDEMYVQERLQKGDNEAAFRHLLIAQCNQLSQIMLFLFEKINDYTELLLPASLLHTDSVISRLVSEIDEDDFREVEIIGWMYQYYIAEKKDQVFAELKKNKKISKENIPAATQLFTPAWIVKYMVENSLGRLWLEVHPSQELQKQWKYYLEPAEQDSDTLKQLDSIVFKDITPEEIKVIDPACGSGHILVYAFELLYQIYQSVGYPIKEIPKLILEKNIYGLDIDERAVQMASFSLLMKARQKNRHVFKQYIRINVSDIKESNGLGEDAIRLFAGDLKEDKSKKIKEFLEAFHEAKNVGSLLNVDNLDIDYVEQRLLRVNNISNIFDKWIIDRVMPLVEQAKILKKKYHVVLTNPPYMGNRGMNLFLSNFINNNYSDFKSDIFGAFIERCRIFLKPNGLAGMITQPSWLFLSSFEKMRLAVVKDTTIYSLLHMGRGIFGIDWGSVSFVFRKCNISKFIGIYFRLHQRVFQYIYYGDIEKLYLSAIANKNFSADFSLYKNKENNNGYIFADEKNSIEVEQGKQKIRFMYRQSDFKRITGCPIAYWASEKIRRIFRDNPKLGDLAEPRQGLATSDNNRFLRLWYEVNLEKIGFNFKDLIMAESSGKKWFPYNKGGNFRKWYGNQEYLINWMNDGFEVKNYATDLYKSYTRTIKNIPYYFREGITWSFVSSLKLGVRYSQSGFIFDVGGSMLFPKQELIPYLIAFLSSKLAYIFLQYLNPTLNFQVGNIKDLPIIIENKKTIIEPISRKNISLSKNDWDSFETSWDFDYHPFLTYQNETSYVSQAFKNWADYAEDQFRQLQANEEELNRIFINIYALDDELTPEVPDEEITVRLADRERDAKSFLSYAIGCMMGRYSLDMPGLAYAGGEFDWSKYQRFLPDLDGILPITDKSYFEDDIMDRLAEFLKVIFGKDTLQENLYWLAESLTIKNNETPVERLRRYFMDEFYKDHLQVYQKRPIYWLFDSGRKKGFRALVYLHRYNPQTLAKMRLDYLQEMQVKYANEEQLLLQRLEQPNLSRAEKTATNKRLEEVRTRQRELIDYDKLLADYANRRIDLDLDDGVVVNYAKLQPLLATIR